MFTLKIIFIKMFKILFLSLTLLTIKASIFKNITSEIDDKSKNIEQIRGRGRSLGSVDEVKERLKLTDIIKFPTMGNIPTKLKIASEKDAYYYFPVASFTYCDFEDIKKFNGIFIEKLGPGLKLQKGIYHKQLKTFIVIMSNDKLKEIVIGVRGTAENRNWIENLKILKESFLNIPNVEVHSGFKLIADAMFPKVNEAIKSLLADKKYKDYKLNFIGHSLGGAVGILTAAMIQKEQNVPWEKIKIFTYGQPRTGNLDFAKWINSVPVTYTRVVNENDIVPHMIMPVMGYYHTFHEMYIHDLKAKICSTEFIEDVYCSYTRIDVSVSAHSNAWDMKNDNALCKP